MIRSYRGGVHSTLVLRPGREKSLLRMHPWIFSGAVAQLLGDAAPGDTVRVESSKGDPLGWAAWSPASALRARMWSFEPHTNIDADFVTERVIASTRRRDDLASMTDAARLVFSEADGLPGVIADRYADTIVVQFGAPGADRWRDAIADALFALDGVRSVYERSDTDARVREGLPPRTGVLRGESPHDEIVIRERDMRYAVGVIEGHKTGFYLDQRAARGVVAEIAANRRVLNAFAYTGAFSVIAARHGAAAITSLDSSGPALEGARRNAALNDVEIGDTIEGDAFAELRKLRDRARSYDLIMLDPPKLAATDAHLQRATRAYKDLNLLAAKLLAPGGILMTFSCSAAMTADLFQKVVAGAALDARRNLRIIGRLDQPSDHPVPLAFPEAGYLKGLMLQAD